MDNENTELVDNFKKLKNSDRIDKWKKPRNQNLAHSIISS